MSGQDLVNNLNQLAKDLEDANRAFVERGKSLAKKEQEYKIALAQAALRLREAGYPVTFIDKIIYGDKAVYPKRLERDIAKAEYESVGHRIQILKIQIRIVEDHIKREWGQS